MTPKVSSRYIFAYLCVSFSRSLFHAFFCRCAFGEVSCFCFFLPALSNLWTWVIAPAFLPLSIVRPPESLALSTFSFARYKLSSFTSHHLLSLQVRPHPTRSLHSFLCFCCMPSPFFCHARTWFLKVTRARGAPRPLSCTISLTTPLM